MALSVQDAARPRDASSPQLVSRPDYQAEADRGRLELRGDEQPRIPSQLNPSRTLAEEILAGFRAGYWKGENSFDLESHGGYAHTVTGTIAYLDEEAQTFMVLTREDELARVPLRDIVSTRGTPLEEHRHLWPGNDDDDDIGTGPYQQSGRTSQASGIRWSGKDRVPHGLHEQRQGVVPKPIQGDRGGSVGRARVGRIRRGSE